MLESRKKIEIPLRAASGQQKKLAGSDLIRPTIENEYAQRYLETMGVHATKEKVEYMLSNMPVDRALVVPVWTRSALIVVPERIEEKDQNVIKQIYTGTKDIEISKRKLVSFFGKGVSEPGTGPRPAHRRPGTSESIRQRSKESMRGRNPLVEIDFPAPAAVPVLEVDSQSFRQLIKPLAVSDGRVKMAVKSFCACLADFVPRIFEDKTGRVNVSIQKFLSCLMCRRLYGLLCHYVFWNIVHPFVRRALVAAKAQQGHLLGQNKQVDHSEDADVDNSAFQRRKSMMNFSSPDLKSMIHVAAKPSESTHTAGRAPKGSFMVSRANKLINANRAVTMFGGRTLSNMGNFEEGNQAQQQQRSGEGGEGGVDGGPSTAELTLSSETSLTSEEKEMLYLQLEQCLNKLHVQMGFSRHALINARESLVASCHYIVNEIMQAHYTWLGGKKDSPSEEMRSAALQPSPSRRGVSYGFLSEKVSEPILTEEEKKDVESLRKEILKHINKTLTELLDPARVYCDKIEKEMFGDEDNDIAAEKKSMTESSLSQPTGDAISHKHKPPGEKNSYYATSVAVRALLSESKSHHARKFLHMNAHPSQPQIQAKYKSREHGVTGEPSIFTTGTGSLVSNADSLYKESEEISFSPKHGAGATLSPSPSRPSTGTMGDFKSLFDHDRKVHPRQTIANFNPKHSILYKRSDSVEQSIRESRGGLRAVAQHDPNRHTIATPTGASRAISSRGLRRAETSDLVHQPLKRPQRNSKQAVRAEALLSADTKGKLMNLVVERTKSKYTDSHVLQFARAPNARYRQELLSGGSGS